MIRVARIRKGLRLLMCKVSGNPLDPDLARDVDVFRLRFRAWLSAIAQRPLDVRLRHEFNLWAEKGIGEGMDTPHGRIIEMTLPKMDLAAGDRVLDLACGAGMASRLMAGFPPDGRQVVGMDISDRMLQRARDHGAHFRSLSFVCGSAEHMPFPDNFFTKALSVEAFYYFEHQERVLAELYRVLAPRGRLFLLICLYKDHADSLSTVEAVSVPVHVRSIAEYNAMLEDSGWTGVSAQEFIREPQSGRKPDVHDRALLLSAQKPTSPAQREVPRAQGDKEGWICESIS